MLIRTDSKCECAQMCAPSTLRVHTVALVSRVLVRVWLVTVFNTVHGDSRSHAHNQFTDKYDDSHASRVHRGVICGHEVCRQLLRWLPRVLRRRGAVPPNQVAHGAVCVHAPVHERVDHEFSVLELGVLKLGIGLGAALPRPRVVIAF